MVRITLDKPYIPIPVPVTAIKYGLLYNWYAATDVRNIAADGWEVPNKTNWETLMLRLDPTGLNTNNVAGGKLKEIGLDYWDNPNIDATNEVSFNGRGGGRRLNDGSFLGLKSFNMMSVYNPSITFPISVDLNADRKSVV